MNNLRNILLFPVYSQLYRNLDIKSIGGKVIEKIPEIADKLTKLTEDKEFQGKLEKAGSIGALLNIGITLFGEIKKSLTTPEQRAFASLVKIMLESGEKTLPKSYDISLKEITRGKEEFIKDLFDKFIETTELYSSPPSYLPYHPVITKFRDQMCFIIKNTSGKEPNYFQNNIVQIFVFNFNKYIVDAIENETLEEHKELKDLITNWKVRITTEKLRTYLDFMYSLQFTVRRIDKKYLKEYYIPNRTVKVTIDTWGIDFSIESNYDIYHKWDIKQFLNNENEYYIIIAAPFGVGKTSFVIDLTSTYAYNYLYDPNSLDNYIPIFVRLKDNFKNIYYQQDFDNVLNLISTATNNKVNILVFLDGLDEYPGKIEDIVELISKKHMDDQFPRIKFVITTRMEPGLPQKLQIKEYVRLLQFDTKQVEAFLNNYGIDYRLDEIAKEFGLEEQEIKKPLFCWMFSMIYSKSKDHIQYLKNRSLLYHEFIHSVIRGKHIEEAKEYDFKKYYIKEKKIMRKIAALKQIYLDDLTKKILIERIKEFGLEINDDDNGILNPILNSYFYSKIADSSEEETIDFVHDSFREYLLAEYYIESILDNKIFRLNARLPTMETINFLDGIINLLLEKKDSKIYNLVSEKSDGLLRSFDYNKKQDNAIKDLFELTFECIEKENIVFFNNNKKDTLKEENKTESIWVSPSISYDDYRILLVHKWIALYIYNNLNISKDISNFKGIEKVIFLTSKFMPVYLKNLKYIDLSELNLTEADLSGADLRGSVLTKAKLIEADLTGADLTGADLTGADLTGADLTRAKLVESDLTRATFNRSNLRGSVLTKAKLIEADLTGANLSGADLTETEMIDAIITEADLTGADLTSADLTRIEITGTDLRNVRNLTISKEDAKQSGAIV